MAEHWGKEACFPLKLHQKLSKKKKVRANEQDYEFNGKVIQVPKKKRTNSNFFCTREELFSVPSEEKRNLSFYRR